MDSTLPFIGHLGGPEMILILMMIIAAASLVLMIAALVSCLSAIFKEPSTS